MTRQVNPEMLTLARESRGLLQSELAELLSVQQGTVSKMESGVLPVTDEMERRLSSKLRYPVTFFYQTDPIYGFNSTVFFHRKRQSLPDRILRKLHARMNLIRMRVSRLLRSAEIQTVTKFQPIEPEEYRGDIEVIAGIVRSMWLIPPGPVRSVTRAIENAGGIVVPVDFESRMADAISEWVPPYPPIFLVNSSADIPGDRLRMTLAHELGHVLMHRVPNPAMEKQAAEFASAFLMPRREIKSSLYNLSLPKLMDIKRQWAVSMAGVIERAHSLQTITASQRRYLHIQLARAGYRTHEPLSEEIPIEKPELLQHLIHVHQQELGYSEAELANMLLFFDDDDFRSEYIDRNRLRLVG